MDQSKALFIGYCSLPISLKQTERKDFLNDQIGSLFSQYKIALQNYSPDRNDYGEPYLFTPHYYYLWGKYDACVISEIDDFEFATRFFRPYNPIVRRGESQYNDDNKRAALEHFDYKVITGINPIQSAEYGMYKLPYIGISQLKINSALQIGNGIQLVSAITKKIRFLIKEITKKSLQDEKKLNIQYKITESFSYHELVIVLHSNSIGSIKQIITKIRNLTVSSLDEYDVIVSNSILSELIGKERMGEKRITNHVFESTHTTLGVHNEVHDSGFKEWSTKSDNPGVAFVKEDIKLISRWNVKSGHCQMVYDVLNKYRTRYNVTDITTIAGRGDILVSNTSTIDPSSQSDVHPLQFPGNFFLDANDKLDYHVVETFTTVGFDFDESPQVIDYDTHKDIHDKLRKYQIERPIIENAIAGMRKAGVPKVLSEKVLKLVSNYNNAVINPDMYASFAELYFFITQVLLGTITEYANNNGQAKFNTRVLIEKIEVACTCLEVSFQNRFYQSYWMSEVLEVNIDYSGGVHNLISAYDSCFKELNNALRSSKTDLSFVYVKSDHDVLSYAECLLLNYLHLSQPYIFSVISCYEAFNFAVEKWYYSKRYNNVEKDDALRRILGLLTSANIKFKGEYLNEDFYKSLDIKKLLEPGGPLVEVDYLTSDSVRFKIIRFINEHTLRYYITDLINLKYTYGGDFKIFCKNTWFYIIQLGNIYDVINVMNSNAFITVSIRLALVRKFAKADSESIYPIELNTFLDEQIKQYKDDILFFVERLTENTDFKKWFEEWADIINSNKYELMPDNSIDSSLQLVVKNIDTYLLNNRNEPIDPVITELNKIDITTDNLFKIYIHIITHYIRFFSSNVKVLIRSTTNGRPTISPSQQNTDLFIDPCGGTFVIGEKNRKNYLLGRVKFIRLLTHISSLQKRRYFKEILNRS